LWAGPLVSLVLLALLLAIARSLPDSQPTGGYSTAGAFLRDHLRSTLTRGRVQLQPSPRRSSVDLYFVRGEGGLRVLDPDDDSWDEASLLLAAHPEGVLRIRYRPEIVRSGFWGITHRVDHHALQFDFGSAFTSAERDAARRRFLARAAVELPWVPDAVFAALARGETIDRSTNLYGGYALDLFTLLLAAAFVLSLRWVLGLPAHARAWRARHALACGRCPGCGYSLADLQRGVCPECGLSLPLRR
jgi:hypothetical protein